MKNFIAILLFSILVSNISFGQSTFQRVIVGEAPNNYGVESTCAVESDRNGIFIGASLSDNGAILKVDSVGSIEWARMIEVPNSPNNLIRFNTVIPTKDSNALYLGTMQSINSIQGPVIAMKVTPNGDTLWTTLFSASSNTTGYTCGVELPDSSCIISWSNFLDSPTFGLARISSLGTVIWSKILSYGINTNISSIEFLSDSTVLLAGKEILVDIDIDGNVQWSKHFLGLYFDDIRPIPNGFMTTTQNLVGFAPFREFNKFNNSGEMDWAVEYTSVVSAGTISNYHSSLVPWDDATSLFHYHFDDQFDIATALLIDTNGVVVSEIMNVYMVGRGVTRTKDNGALFTGFGPLYGLKSGNTDLKIGLVKTDSLLNSSDCIEITTINTTSTPLYAGSPIVIDSIGVPQLVTIPLIISIPILNQLDQCVGYTGGIDETLTTIDVNVFPNYSTGVFNFETNSSDLKRVTVTDELGRIVYSSSESSPDFTVDLTLEKTGFYTYTIESDQKSATRGSLLILN